MSVEWKFEYEPEEGDTSVVLSEYYDPMVRVKAGDGSDSFEVKVNNVNHDYDLYFNPNSKVEIFRRLKSNNAWSTDDVLMNASIRQVPQTIDSSKDLLRVSGYNYSESVGGTLIFVGGSPVSVASYLENAVNSARDRNKNFSVTWHPDNPTLKQDNTSFPDISDKSFNKTLNYIMEKYSTDEYTEDGEYYWFVDKNNQLIWRPRSTKVESGDNFIESSDSHKSIKISKDIKDVKNYVIVKGGRDPEGNSLQVYVPNYSSIAKNGFRYYIFTNEARTAENNLSADLSKAGKEKMVNATYPFVTTWDLNSYSSYGDYLDAFRAFHKDNLKSLGLAYIETRKNGKLKVDITFQALEKTWGLGQLISTDISSLSAGAKPLRIEEIQYTTTTDTYTLIEDEGSI